MKYRIILKNQAERDLRQAGTYFLEHLNQNGAVRFLEAAERSFDRLAQMPEIGKSCQIQHPRLADVRQWRVKGFENYLIFYRITELRIEVLRVVHGSQDLSIIFQQLETEPDDES